MISPRIVKGGLVEVELSTGRTTNVIALQYNPEQLSRTLAVRASGDGRASDRSQALRLAGPAVETLQLEAVLDATDALAAPDSNPDAVELGLHPQLAALELLAHPAADTLAENDTLAGSGVLEILPRQAPLTLFVWSRQRVVPVRLTELSITEEAFDVNLNPIRARVALSMRVLSVDDLGFSHRGGAQWMSHLRTREALAARARSIALSALGVETL